MKKKLTSLVAAVLALAAIAAAPASADHSWGGYHWAQANAGGASVRVDLGDNLLVSRSTNWPAIFNGTATTGANVVFNWTNLNLFPLGTGNTFSDVLNTARVAGANTTSQKRCKPRSGRVEVCNARYGANGWLGLASVWTSGGHIVQGTVKVNDTYLDSASYSAADKQHVLCQEVGHTVGLDHTSEDGRDDQTCMDYATGLENPHTNGHDNEQINAIYGSHTDGTATATTTAPSGSGNARRVRKDLYVESLPNGGRLFTFVTFVDDAAARRAPHDRVPE